MDMYESIDPAIRDHFNRTFGGFFRLPQLGTAIGGGLFAYASFFNFSIPTRVMMFAVPLALDWFRTMRNPESQVRSAQLLDWVFEFRKARAFNERHRDLFQNP